jgi:hypothetical protein
MHMPPVRLVLIPQPSFFDTEHEVVTLVRVGWYPDEYKDFFGKRNWGDGRTQS